MKKERWGDDEKEKVHKKENFMKNERSHERYKLKVRKDS